MFVLLIASNPIHSTFALSQALQAGSLPSHFCFLLLHLVQELIALATLYCVPSSTVEEEFFDFFVGRAEFSDKESPVEEFRLLFGRLELEDGGGMLGGDDGGG